MSVQPSLDTAIAKLGSGATDAVNDDAPALGDHLCQHPGLEMRMASFHLAQDT